MPKNIDTFIDLFCGGCTLAINVDAKRVIANDIATQLIDLYSYMRNTKHEQIELEINQIVKEFKLSDSFSYGYDYYKVDALTGLSSYNKENYLHLRDSYNQNPTAVKFYTLLLFAFNNQIRFNKKNHFNMPIGKRDFNKKMREKLKKFVLKMQSLDLNLYSKDFKEIEISKNSFIYADPPYLITLASYSDTWDAKKEYELLNYLDAVHLKGEKFALSNALRCKDLENKILKNWLASNNYKTHFLSHNYNNSSYHKKNKNDLSIQEILVTNY